MPRKKSFTSADSAIDKLFTVPNKGNSKEANNTHHTNDNNHTNNDKVSYDTDIEHIEKYTHVSHDTNNYKPANKSKHYDKRGKRAERFGLLLDEQLKNDLTLLSKAINSKSINDLIVTVLLEYVDRQENQARLKQYRELLQS